MKVPDKQQTKVSWFLVKLKMFVLMLRWWGGNTKLKFMERSELEKILKICVQCLCPLRFICWNLIPNVKVFGGGVFGKGIAFLNGISAFRKEIPDSCFFWHVKTQPEEGALRNRRLAFARHQICYHLGLGLCRLKNCKRYKPPSQGQFCDSSLNGLRHVLTCEKLPCARCCVKRINQPSSLGKPLNCACFSLHFTCKKLRLAQGHVVTRTHISHTGS